MFDVKIFDAIAEAGLDQLRAANYGVNTSTDEYQAILLRSRNIREMDFPTTLVAVARAGAGVNNVPIERLSELGVVVFNTPGANANAVKELVIAALLVASRNIVPALNFVAELDMSQDDYEAQMEAFKRRLAGTEIKGRTLGVVGLGAVGVQVSNAASSLGMRVLGFDPQIRVASALELSNHVRITEDLGALLDQVDAVSLHVPLLESTRNLLSDAELGRLKSDALLLNFSRRGIVDEAALNRWLASESKRKYVSDFPSPEISRYDQVISFPHLGASTAEAEENCAVMAAQQLRAYLEHGEIKNSVNFPAVAIPRSPHAQSQYRVAIVNNNVPNMLGQISSCFAAHGMNIVDMVNRSRGELAITLADIDREPGEALREALRTIEGVRRVRLI